MRKSFTLVEMIVVIAIIAILAAVVVPSAFKAIEKSKVSKAVADVRAITKAATLFYADVGLWPGSQWGNMPGGGGCSCDPLSNVDYGVGFVEPPTVNFCDPNIQNTAREMIEFWDGPYLEHWSRTPWGMNYMWDFNNWDANNNGIRCEHIVWLDLKRASDPGQYGQENKVPLSSQNKIDEVIDGGDGLVQNGSVCIMQVPGYGRAFMVIAYEGE